ncbi:MAG: hypothetical protein IVW51_12045 [Thermaceae bacterium]|nr:hypothetical protein [Thermaceae bacterium]
MRVVWLVLILVFSGFWLVRSVQARPIPHGPGILAPYAPTQTMLSKPGTLQFKGYTINAVARFEIQARVLSKHLYRYDAGAKLSPVDLALGWGRMSDSSVLKYFSIRQSDRFYFWSAGELPIPYEEVVNSSANMHMIPADERIAKYLQGLRPGNIVYLKGYLVNVTGPNGFYWNTSLTRSDSGNGACESVWVESLSIK